MYGSVEAREGFVGVWTMQNAGLSVRTSPPKSKTTVHGTAGPKIPCMSVNSRPCTWEGGQVIQAARGWEPNWIRAIPGAVGAIYGGRTLALNFVSTEPRQNPCYILSFTMPRKLKDDSRTLQACTDTLIPTAMIAQLICTFSENWLWTVLLAIRYCWNGQCDSETFVGYIDYQSHSLLWHLPISIVWIKYGNGC